MVKNYWVLFCLTLVGMILFVFLFVMGFVFAKKIVSGKKYGVIMLLVCQCAFLTLSILCTNLFTLCCKDYRYVSSNSYIEEKATVVEFTSSKIDYDGNGRRRNSKPKFYLIEKDEYIVLYARDVEVGKTYTIRYYPNTKICDVQKIEEMKTGDGCS